MRNTSKFFGLLLLSSMLQLSPSFAEGDTAIAPTDDKMYVTRKALRFVKNEIIVRNKEGTFAAKGLFSDENGFYVKKAELEQVRVLPAKKNRHLHHGKWNKKRSGKDKDCYAGKDGKRKNRTWKARKEESPVSNATPGAPIITQ